MHNEPGWEAVLKDVWEHDFELPVPAVGLPDSAGDAAVGFLQGPRRLPLMKISTQSKE